MSESESPSRPISRRLSRPSLDPRQDRHAAKQKLGSTSGKYDVQRVKEVGDDPTLVGKPADKPE